MIAKVNELLPEIQPYADEAITTANARLGLDLFITTAYRTPAEQDRLYAQGRTTPGAIVTYLKGKESMHCQRKAFDLADHKLGYNVDWVAIGKIITGFGWFHGRNFPGFQDNPHFEWQRPLPTTPPTTERKNMYEIGCKVEAITQTMLRETPSDIGVGVPTRGGLGNIFDKGWTALVSDKTSDWNWYNLNLGGQSGWVKFDTIKAVPNDPPPRYTVVEDKLRSDLAAATEKINKVKGIVT